MTDYITTIQGDKAIIDSEDADLKEFNWSTHKGYVVRNIGPRNARGRVSLHGIILERKLGRAILYEHGCVADHKNGDTLDNRRENLREATPSQSSANTAAKGKSKYRGVSLDSSVANRKNKWVAQVFRHGRRVFIKRYPTETEAAKAYDEQAKLVHGAFARLNFPSPISEEVAD